MSELAHNRYMALDPLVARSMSLAEKAHFGQELEETPALPYLLHPFRVMEALHLLGGVKNPKMLAAAILHDSVEQGGMTLDAIALELGGEVASLVAELTRREPTESEISGLTKDEIWEMRSSMLLEEIAKMSPKAHEIKLADRQINLVDAKRFKEGRKLKRYLKQTERIIEIIPRSTNPGLWDAIKNELKNCNG